MTRRRKADRPARKAIPWRVKVRAILLNIGKVPPVAVEVLCAPLTEKMAREATRHLLAAYGLPADTQFDHHPALGLRLVNAAGTDYEPPQLDPAGLVPRPPAEHHTKTTGNPPGVKGATVANGDTHKVAKGDRLAERHAEFRNRVTVRRSGEDESDEWSRSSSFTVTRRAIPSRPFQKREKAR